MSGGGVKTEYSQLRGNSGVREVGGWGGANAGTGGRGVVGVCGTIQELSSVVAEAAGRDGGNIYFKPSKGVRFQI